MHAYLYEKIIACIKLERQIFSEIKQKNIISIRKTKTFNMCVQYIYSGVISI